MTCVIVLGLPRSGTSAMGGALQAMGVHMGDHLMPAMAGVNDKGFFEDEEFVNLHVRLMRAHEDPQILFDVPDPPAADVLQQYEAAIRRREAREWWGVKDPKLCFLLPYFLRRLAVPYKVIATRRPFHESVQSMMPLYGGMTLDRASHLLSRYLYSLDKALSGISWENAFEVQYHEMIGYSLLNDWRVPEERVRRGLFERVASFLGLPGDGYELARKAAATIDPSLHRQR